MPSTASPPRGRSESPAPRHRHHPELLEDDHVTVAAAEEDEILSKWKVQRSKLISKAISTTS